MNGFKNFCAVVVAALTAHVASAAPIIIDDFSAAQLYTDSVNFGVGPDFSSPASAGILGGHRGVAMRYTNPDDIFGTDPNKFVEVDINGQAPNRLRIANTGSLLRNGQNNVYLDYDGTEFGLSVSSQFGLPMVDLTGGGSNNHFEFTLHKSAPIRSVFIGINSGTDESSQQSSSISLPISGTDDYEQTIRIPFADLQGTADFTAITTIFFWITSNASKSPIEVSNFRVAGANPPPSAILSSPNAAINDLAMTSDSINVHTDGREIAQVSLYLDLEHTFNGDLDITLTNPNGSSIVISTDNGGSRDNIFGGTLFDDAAVRSNQRNYVTDYLFTDLSAPPLLAPEQALHGLSGNVDDGNWTLSITDDGSGDIGVLKQWGLEIKFIDTPIEPDIFNSVAIAEPETIVSNAIIQQTLNLPDKGGVLCGMDLTLNIRHSFNADLDIFLMSPLGIEVAITTDNGAGNDDVFSGTTFISGSSSEPVTDANYTNGETKFVVSSEAPLSAFDGFNPAGEWTLSVADDQVGDEGSLDAWSIEYALCGVDDELCVPIKTSNGNIALICL